MHNTKKLKIKLSVHTLIQLLTDKPNRQTLNRGQRNRCSDNMNHKTNWPSVKMDINC